MNNEPEVLYYDNHLLALNKPAGWVSQPTVGHVTSAEEWGKKWIKNKFSKPGEVFLHAVHRLDKGVGGILLFARTSKALSRLQESLREQKVKKNYIALVEGKWEQEEGCLENWLLHDSHQAIEVASTHPQAKRCTLKFNKLFTSEKHSCLKIELHTGRYHQIRLQLASAGHPVLGDKRYGGEQKWTEEGIALIHYAFSIPHPVLKDNFNLKISLPEKWSSLSVEL